VKELIWFNVPQAFQFLIREGRVYTLRHKIKKEGEHALMSSLALYGPSTGYRVRVEFVKRINQTEDLIPFLPKSGFKHLEDWLKEAKGAPFLHLVILMG